MTDTKDLKGRISKEWDDASIDKRGNIMQDVLGSVDREKFQDELAVHMYIMPHLVLDARLNDFKSEKDVGRARDAKRDIQRLFNPDFLGLMHNDVPVDWNHLHPIDATTLSKVLGHLQGSKGLTHLKDIIDRAWDAQDYQNALSCGYARYGQSLTKALGQHDYYGTNIVAPRLKDDGKQNVSDEVAKSAMPLWQMSEQGVRPLEKKDLFDILKDIDNASQQA